MAQTHQKKVECPPGLKSFLSFFPPLVLGVCMHMGHFTRLGYRPIMPTLRNKQHSFALVVIFVKIFLFYIEVHTESFYMIPNLYTFDNIFMAFFTHKCEKKY